MAIHDPWKINQIIEHKYFRSLIEIIKYLRRAIEYAMDPFTIVRILKGASSNPVFRRYAQEVAEKMVTNLIFSGAKTWRQAARESGKGNIIYEALRREMQGPVGGKVLQQIERNAQLIKTLPDDIAERVVGYIGRESQKGRRASDIAKDIQEMFPESSRARAQLIARTEVSKTSVALTQARSENMGLSWYIWRTSEDSRVRSSHSHMDHVIINWNDPPSPEKLIGEKSVGNYHAGNIWNCRCYPQVVVDINRVQFPHKVYYNGAILNITLDKFKKLVS